MGCWMHSLGTGRQFNIGKYLPTAFYSPKQQKYEEQKMASKMPVAQRIFSSTFIYLHPLSTKRPTRILDPGKSWENSLHFFLAQPYEITVYFWFPSGNTRLKKEILVLVPKHEIERKKFHDFDQILHL